MNYKIISLILYMRLTNFNNIKIINNNTILIIGLICILLFVYYLHRSTIYNIEEKFEILPTKDSAKIDQNICSINCCNFVQWPIPFMYNTYSSNPPNSIDFNNYIGSNFSCNNGDTGGGCVCIQKTDYEYLSNHGQI